MTAISDLSLQISTPSHRNTPNTKRPRTQERPGNRHSGSGTPLSTALGTETLRQASQGGNRDESRSQKNCGRTKCASGWYNGRDPREGQGLDEEDHIGCQVSGSGGQDQEVQETAEENQLINYHVLFGAHTTNSVQEKHFSNDVELSRNILLHGLRRGF